MTTVRQVKTIAAPLLARSSDLALSGRFVLVTPIRHIVAGLIIDRTRSAVEFRTATTAFHLCELTQSIGLAMSEQVYRPGSGIWRTDDPQSAEFLLDALEPIVVPKLRALMNFERYIAFAKHRDDVFLRQPLRRIIIDIAMGDLDGARKISREAVAPLDVATFGRDADDKDRLQRVKELCRRLDCDDRAGMVALLHEWEAISVRNLKLENLHERTPFPLESQAG